MPRGTEVAADLVLEGGGIKAIAHVGAVCELLERGWRVPRAAGSSAGALVAALTAAGAGPEELRSRVAEAPFPCFADPSPLDRVPLLGPLWSLLGERGVFEGEALRRYTAEALSEHGVETFGDLRLDDDAADPGPDPAQDRGYSLVVVVTDVTRGLLLRLPWDYRRFYGLDPDRQSVAEAVRASAALPYFYEPARLVAADGSESLLSDGGVLSNFPIDTFDRTDGRPSRWPTLGVKLSADLPEDRARVTGVLGRLVPAVRFTELLASTLVVGRDQTRLASPGVAERTAVVDTSGVGLLELDLDQAGRDALVLAGREAMAALLERQG